MSTARKRVRDGTIRFHSVLPLEEKWLADLGLPFCQPDRALLCEAPGGIHRVDVRPQVFSIGTSIVIWARRLQVVVATIATVKVYEANL